MKEYTINDREDIERFKREYDRRRETNTLSADNAVRIILDDVKSKGDRALIEYTEKYDGVKLSPDNIKVSSGEMFEAMSRLPISVLSAMKNASENIRTFHEHEKEQSWFIEKSGGTRLGIRISPIGTVGVYVPGGRAPLPSSVLMNVIPAKVAGVSKVIMCTPPGKDGRINSTILSAAGIAGVDEIYKVGGAQAIGAMAFGTETVPKVDKITGPGNAYVAAAKKAVFGTCGIDMIAGPSEILIIADRTADPEFVAADMLSQAEHDPMAASVLITTSLDLASNVKACIEKQLVHLSREVIARSSLDKNGSVILVKDTDTGAEIANAIAPEHLEIMTSDMGTLVQKIRNAGAVFCGKWSSEPMGDYYCGTNHILPTGGTARFSSPLGVWDFVKRTSVIEYTQKDLEEEGPEVVTFAKEEGLTAHARSVGIRLDKIERKK